MTTGISQQVQEQFDADDLRRLTGDRSTAFGIYERPDGGTCGPLPMAKHAYYALQRGMTLIAVTNTAGMLTKS